MAGSPEHSIQCAFFEWARAHPVARRAFAVPNGGLRSTVTAARLKREGVRSGVLDCMLPVAAGGSAGLWIEFKAGRNKLTPEQEKECEALADQYAVLVTNDPLVAVEHARRYLSGEIPPGVVSQLVRAPSPPRASPSRRRRTSAPSA